MLVTLMFEVWNLKRSRRNVITEFRKERAALGKSDPPQEKVYALDAREYWQVSELERTMDQEASLRLLDIARDLDILIPTLESEGIWVQDPNTGRIWLSSQGRFAVRKLVDDEKARRLEGRTRWITTLILPLLAGLVGIIGALTGLIAVWQHGK